VKLRLYLLIVSLLVTSACTTQPKKSTEVEQGEWIKFNGHAFKHQSWALNGRFVVRNESESWHGDIYWQQENETYLIRLSGPLGQGKVQLKGKPGHSELQLSENEYYIAEDAERLLSRFTGVVIPVEGLRYWVLGVPRPNNVNAGLEQDEQGRLVRITQHGWDVQIKRYDQVDGETLPTKLFMDNKEYKVRLVVDQWQLKA